MDLTSGWDTPRNIQGAAFSRLCSCQQLSHGYAVKKKKKKNAVKLQYNDAELSGDDGTKDGRTSFNQSFAKEGKGATSGVSFFLQFFMNMVILGVILGGNFKGGKCDSSDGNDSERWFLS